MKTKVTAILAIGTFAATSLLCTSISAAPAMDAKAALALAKKSGCIKCHDVKEKKEAKSFTEIAKKYKGKADADEKLNHHITSGEKVKLDDGSEEEHKIIKSKDPAEIQNVVAWVRSLAK